jgi:hypothetical protein
MIFPFEKREPSSEKLVRYGQKERISLEAVFRGELLIISPRDRERPFFEYGRVADLGTQGKDAALEISQDRPASTVPSDLLVRKVGVPPSEGPNASIRERRGEIFTLRAPPRMLAYLSSP